MNKYASGRLEWRDKFALSVKKKNTFKDNFMVYMSPWLLYMYLSLIREVRPDKFVYLFKQIINFSRKC